MSNRSTKGFTLIEVLIVIAIIGILAAALIPNLLSGRTRAFDVAAQACLREIATQEGVIASQTPFAHVNSLDILAELPTFTACGPSNTLADATSEVIVALGDSGGTDGFHYTAYAKRGTVSKVYEVLISGAVTPAPPLVPVRGTHGQGPTRGRGR